MRPASEGVLFDHIALGLHRIEDAMPFVVGELGGAEPEGGPNVAFTFGQWRFSGGGCLELLEPVGAADGFLRRFLASHGPGVHHVTFKVPDLRKAADRASELGYRIVGYDDSHPGWKEAFLHPKEAQGIVVQLAESDPGHDEMPDTPWRPPPAPAPADPVEIVGLRLSAVSEEAARRQWEGVLGGTCVAGAGELIFRWPGSPMRVAVTLRPGRPEGPLWIELAADRPVALSDGPEPILGTTFVQIPNAAR